MFKEVKDISFSSWLAFQLNNTGTKITELAQFLGITRTCVYRYLGKTYDKRFVRDPLPTPAIMLKILEYFDIPTSPTFLDFARPRGGITNHLKRKYKKLMKRYNMEYDPVDFAKYASRQIKRQEERQLKKQLKKDSKVLLPQNDTTEV